MANSATPAALAQPAPISLTYPATPQAWVQFASTLNQWLQYVAGTPVAFTPTLTATSGAPVYSVQTARYVRNGSAVTFSATLAISSIGSLTGPVSVAGLPVLSQNTLSVGTAFPVYAPGVTPSGTNYAPVGYLAPGMSAIQIYMEGSATPAPLAASQLGSGSALLISGTYFIL